MALGPFDQPIPNDVLKTVAEVVPKLEVRDIRLVNLTCGLLAPAPPAGSVSIELGHTVKVEVVEGNALAVHVQYSLKGSPDGPDSAPYVNLSVVFQLLYDGDGLTSIAPEKLQAFGEINGVHNAWPYFREVVQSMSTRMGLPSMTVPLLKITKTTEKAPARTD